ncbi:deoxyribonuclease IV [Candidatus Uhrbacteria bacterium]|nr:deoxyribonuclease IV [Candidatus Uhrbacteria bacterium]
MPLIGGHVSVAGGLYKAFENAVEIGAEAIQIFGVSPRQWAVPLPLESSVDAFKKAWKESDVKAVFLHAPYLPNIASPDADARKKSVASLTSHLRIAGMLGTSGLIFHIGSSKPLLREDAVEVIAESMKEILENVPGQTHLIIENSAGGGSRIGSTPEEIGTIMKMVKSGRVRVCIDTAHAFEAGCIDEYSPKKIVEFFDRCESAFGCEKIVALHVNDSKTAFDSHHDRHENIGQGHIGLAGFQNLAQESRIGDTAWLLEVPGFDDTGPDKKNVDLLKQCFV